MATTPGSFCWPEKARPSHLLLWQLVLRPASLQLLGKLSAKSRRGPDLTRHPSLDCATRGSPSCRRNALQLSDANVADELISAGRATDCDPGARPGDHPIGAGADWSAQASIQRALRSPSGLPRATPGHPADFALQLHFFIARSGEEIIFFFFKKQRADHPSRWRHGCSFLCRPGKICRRAVGPAPAMSAAVLPKSGLGPDESCSYRRSGATFHQSSVRRIDGACAVCAGRYHRRQRSASFCTGFAKAAIFWEFAIPKRTVIAQRPIYTTRTRESLTRLAGRAVSGADRDAARLACRSARQTTKRRASHCPPIRAAMSDVHATLYWFVEAYRSLEAEQKAAKAAAAIPVRLRRVVPSYGILQTMRPTSPCAWIGAGRFATAKGASAGRAGRCTWKSAASTARLVARIALGPTGLSQLGRAARNCFWNRLRSGTSQRHTEGARHAARRG